MKLMVLILNLNILLLKQCEIKDGLIKKKTHTAIIDIVLLLFFLERFAVDFGLC